MRMGMIVGGVLAVIAALVVSTVMVVDVVSQSEQAMAQRANLASCDAMIGPSQPGSPEQGAADARGLDDQQLNTVAKIIAIGKERELGPRAWQIAIQAGMTESGLRSLDHGDRDSLGIFQMRPSMGWGTPAEVTDPEYAINKFYSVLEDVPDWQTRRPGESAQAVERSAFPDRYHRWEAMAVYLVQNLGEVVDAAGCGQGTGKVLAPSKKAAKAIEFALGERGKPYVWGATGPSSYDCSGLMLRAFESAGITLPRVSRDQYNAGAKLSVEDAKPGDMLFWAYDESNPATIHHVAMYLGDGKIVEAQQSGVPVHTRKVAFDEPELLPVAVRPGV